jgi:hypothetical protein
LGLGSLPDFLALATLLAEVRMTVWAACMPELAMDEMAFMSVSFGACE